MPTVEPPGGKGEDMYTKSQCAESRPALSQNSETTGRS